MCKICVKYLRLDDTVINIAVTATLASTATVTLYIGIIVTVPVSFCQFFTIIVPRPQGLAPVQFQIWILHQLSLQPQLRLYLFQVLILTSALISVLLH